MACSMSVHIQVGSLHELLVTDGTGEGALSRVDPLVLHEIAPLEKSLGTVGAMVFSDALVNLAVPSQRLLVHKCGLPLFACTGKLLVVGS